MYVIIFGAVLLVPVERADVAKLRPIEVISIYKEGNTVILQTDTDDLGIGADAMTALADMKAASPAMIYLDTAEYLLIGSNAQTEAAQLRKCLKESVKVCISDARPKLTAVAKYLPVHKKLPQIRDWTPGQKLPVLHMENDRIKIS